MKIHLFVVAVLVTRIPSWEFVRKYIISLSLKTLSVLEKITMQYSQIIIIKAVGYNLKNKQIMLCQCHSIRSGVFCKDSFFLCYDSCIYCNPLWKIIYYSPPLKTKQHYVLLSLWINWLRYVHHPAEHQYWDRSGPRVT